jgi:hypothetical protein
MLVSVNRNIVSRVAGFSSSISAKALQVKTITKKKLKDDIGLIIHNDLRVLFCRAEWNMPELLEYLLKQAGKSRVALTSFSLTVPAVEKIAAIRNAENCSIIILCDRVALKKNQEALKKAKELDLQVYFQRNHSKMILIESDKLNVAVISSANLSRNPRWEATVIIEDKETTSVLFNQVQELCNLPKSK